MEEKKTIPVTEVSVESLNTEDVHPQKMIKSYIFFMKKKPEYNVLDVIKFPQNSLKHLRLIR